MSLAENKRRAKNKSRTGTRTGLRVPLPSHVPLASVRHTREGSGPRGAPIESNRIIASHRIESVPLPSLSRARSHVPLASGKVCVAVQRPHDLHRVWLWQFTLPLHRSRRAIRVARDRLADVAVQQRSSLFGENVGIVRNGHNADGTSRSAVRVAETVDGPLQAVRGKVAIILQDDVSSGLGRTDETSVSLAVHVKAVRVNDVGIDDEARRNVAASVILSLVLRKEANVVSLHADHVGELDIGRRIDGCNGILDGRGLHASSHFPLALGHTVSENDNGVGKAVAVEGSPALEMLKGHVTHVQDALLRLAASQVTLGSKLRTVLVSLAIHRRNGGSNGALRRARSGVANVSTHEHRVGAEARQVGWVLDGVVGAIQLDVDLHGDVGAVLVLTSCVECLAVQEALRGHWRWKLGERGALDGRVQVRIAIDEADEELWWWSRRSTGSLLGLPSCSLECFSDSVWSWLASVEVEWLRDGHAKTAEVVRKGLTKLGDDAVGPASEVDDRPGRESPAWLTELGLSQVPSTTLDGNAAAATAILNLRWRKDTAFELDGLGVDGDVPVLDASRLLKLELVTPACDGAHLLARLLSRLVDHGCRDGLGELARWQRSAGQDLEALEGHQRAVAQNDAWQVEELDLVVVRRLEVVDDADLLTVLFEGLVSHRAWREALEGVPLVGRSVSDSKTAILESLAELRLLKWAKRGESAAATTTSAATVATAAVATTIIAASARWTTSTATEATSTSSIETSATASIATTTSTATEAASASATTTAEAQDG